MRRDGSHGVRASCVADLISSPRHRCTHCIAQQDSGSALLLALCLAAEWAEARASRPWARGELNCATRQWEPRAQAGTPGYGFFGVLTLPLSRLFSDGRSRRSFLIMARVCFIFHFRLFPTISPARCARKPSSACPLLPNICAATSAPSPLRSLLEERAPGFHNNWKSYTGT